MRDLPILKIFILILASLLLFTLIACGKKGEDSTPPDTNDAENTEEESIDRTDPSVGEYRITFFLGNTPSYIVHYYNEGETITPPSDLPHYATTRETYLFDGWDGVAFETVTKNATYRSAIRTEYNYYTASFVVGDEMIEVRTICGDFPKAPKESDLPLAEGEIFAGWSRPLEAFVENVKIEAVTTRYFNSEYFYEAFLKEPIAYTSVIDGTDGENDVTAKATALACLLYEENLNPRGGIVASRIVEHLASVVQKDQAPAFDACCWWSYSILTGAVALAKITPTVWEKVPVDVELRLNVMMRAFAYLESFATSDYNSYETGPGMQGNYKKVWNPNYRLANIPVMVYVTHYFGNGDMTEGAEAVNAMLKGFDESAYTDLINLFQKYGWRRAMRTWTSEAREATDGSGVKGGSAKELLLYGGQAVGEDTSKASDLRVPLGTGAGVTNGGKDYLYNGFTLAQGADIIRAMLRCNYGNDKGYFIEVKSEHWYDTNKDGTQELVAWIVDDLSSPYEGQYGMMREFASGDRSSASYCSHDFLLANTMIMSCKLLGIYDLTTDTYTDPNGVNIRNAVLVGNEDFLFKAENGYVSYATSSYGGYTKTYYDRDADKGSYWALKSFWRSTMKPMLEESISEANP